MSNESFKPYMPNPNTKLGKAYLYAVRELEGPIAVTEANYLRDNPLLWIRAISLHSANLDFLIRQHKTWLKALAPKPGEPQTAEYLMEVRNRKAASIAREHILRRVRVRREELIVELGYSKLTDAVMAGDLVDALTGIIAAIKQEDVEEAQRLAEHWIYRLTGQDASDAEQPIEPEGVSVDPLQYLLNKVRKGRDASQD